MSHEQNCVISIKLNRENCAITRSNPREADQIAPLRPTPKSGL